jgi:hypothetical protein
LPLGNVVNLGLCNHRAYPLFLEIRAYNLAATLVSQPDKVSYLVALFHGANIIVPFLSLCTNFQIGLFTFIGIL